MLIMKVNNYYSRYIISLLLLETIRKFSTTSAVDDFITSELQFKQGTSEILAINKKQNDQNAIEVEGEENKEEESAEEVCGHIIFNCGPCSIHMSFI